MPERRSRDGQRPPRSPSSGAISQTVSGSAGSDGALVGLNHRQEQVPDEIVDATGTESYRTAIRYGCVCE